MQQEAPQIPHGKITLGVAVRGEGGVAGKGRVVGSYTNVSFLGYEYTS